MKPVHVVLIRPAGDGNAAIAVRPDGHIAGHLVADVAFHVCVEQVLGRNVEVAGCFTEFFPVLGFVEAPNGFEGRGRRNAVQAREMTYCSGSSTPVLSLKGRASGSSS